MYTGCHPPYPPITKRKGMEDGGPGIKSFIFPLSPRCVAVVPWRIAAREFRRDQTGIGEICCSFVFHSVISISEDAWLLLHLAVLVLLELMSLPLEAEQATKEDGLSRLLHVITAIYWRHKHRIISFFLARPCARTHAQVHRIASGNTGVDHVLKLLLIGPKVVKHWTEVAKLC